MEETRNFEQEVHDLYEDKPELRGKELPEEVVKACAEGKNLSEAYGEYEKTQEKKTAPMSPVRSVTLGGSVDPKPEDAFLRGFNTAW